MYKVGVLGAGTWGMAVARVLCNRHHSVMVWSALPQEIEYIQKNRTHPKLPELEIPDDIDDLFIMSTNTDHLYDSENGKVFLEKMKETFNSLNNISDYFPEFGNAINDACVDYEYDTNDEYEEDDDEYEDEEVEEDEEEEDEEDEEEEEEEEDDYDMNSDESEENEMIPLMRSDSGILFASFIPEPSTERESEDYDSLDEIE